MKLAFVRAALVAFTFSTVSFTGSSARAETAESRGALMLRDKPTTNGKVVERLGGGAKLTIVDTSKDGGWARVRTKGGREGWVPMASLRTKSRAPDRDRDDAAADDKPDDVHRDDQPLAKRRDVRAESWVSKSKYHDDNDKMTVTATKAELFGRPQAGGTVLGIVRRGETVQFVRKSADKKWVQIDIGAGEMAWVDAKAVRMGADMAPADEDRRGNDPDRDRRDTRRDDEPPPTPSNRRDHETSPADTRRNDRADQDRRDREDRERADRDRADKDRADRDRADKDRADRDRADKDRADRDRADKDRADRADRDRADKARADKDRADRADHSDRDRTSQRDRDRADRDREDRERADRDRDDRRRKREEREDRERAEREERERDIPAHSPNYFDVRLDVGFGRVGEQVRTNSLLPPPSAATPTNLLANYQHLTTGLAIGAEAGYARAFGKLRLHIDLKFVAVLLGSVVFDNVDGSSTLLRILDQNVSAGIAIGGFWNNAGGIDLRLRLGVDAWINQISPSFAPIEISQDVVLGMKIGVVFGMPAVIKAAGRPLGFRLQLGALAPATRLQQPNIVTAPHNTTLGGYANASVFFGLLSNPHKGQLHIELAYSLDFAFSHFTGTCKPNECRDATVTDANYSSVAHVGTIGIYYQY